MSTKTLIAISIAVVTGAIAYGLHETGGPEMQRKLRTDNTRIERLNRIDQAVRSYYQNKKTLPQTLACLKKPEHAYLYNSEDILDPLTEKPLTYHVKSKTAYEICAAFETDSEKLKKRDHHRFGYYSHYNEQWDHPKGNHCFTREVDQTP